MSRQFLTRIPARQWLTVLLGCVVCPALWQVWLTVRMLEQDQSRELQRSRERLGEIADLALAQLSRSLGDWELGLHETERVSSVAHHPGAASERGDLHSHLTRRHQGLSAKAVVIYALASCRAHPNSGRLRPLVHQRDAAFSLNASHSPGQIVKKS